MAMFYDRIFEVMMFVAIVASLITGLLTVGTWTDDDGLFAGVDTRGHEFASQMRDMSSMIKVEGIFNLGEYEGTTDTITGYLKGLMYSAVNAVDWAVGLGIRLLLFFGTIFANLYGAVNLMIMPLQFLFDILGVGEYFSAISLIMGGAVGVCVTFTALRFAIFIWKGV